MLHLAFLAERCERKRYILPTHQPRRRATKISSEQHFVVNNQVNDSLHWKNYYVCIFFQLRASCNLPKYLLLCQIGAFNSSGACGEIRLSLFAHEQLALQGSYLRSDPHLSCDRRGKHVFNRITSPTDHLTPESQIP